MAKDPKETPGIEQELHFNEEFINKLLDSLPTYFVAIDSNGKTKFMNNSMLTVLGYTLSEIKGKDYLSTFVPERDRDLLSKIFRQIHIKKSTVNESHILTKDGRELLVEWHGCPIVTAEGKLDYFFGVGIDITEKRAAEEKLKKEQTFTHSAIEAQRDTFFVFEIATGKPVRWNRAFAEVSGYTDDEIARMKAPDDWYGTEDLQKANQTTLKLLRGETVSAEMFLITKDGRKIPTEYSASAIPDERGIPKYIIALGRDITTRKQAEKAQKKSEERIRALMNATTDSVLLIDRDGVVIDANNAMASALGKTPESLIGTIIYDHLPPDLAEQRKAKGFEAAREKKIIRFEDQRGDRWLYNSIYPILNPQGKLNQFAIFSHDITERKKAEEALKYSEERYRSLTEQIQNTIICYEFDPPIPITLPVEEQIRQIKRGRIVEYNTNLDLNAFGTEGIDKILGREIGEFFDSTGRIEWDKEIREFIHGGYQLANYESTLKGNDGSLFYFLDNAIGIIQNGSLVQAVAVGKNNTEQRKAEKIIDAIYRGTMGTTGKEFFRELVSSMGELLRVRYAFIGELVPGEAIRTLATWVDGILRDNVLYSLQDTPSERVLKQGTCFILSGVRDQFPSDHLLKEMEVESYLGVPLRDASGTNLGILAVMDDRQNEDVALFKNVLEVFAAQASAELGRSKAEKSLQQKEHYYRTLFESASDAIFVMEQDYFLECNHQVLDMFGCSREQILGKTPSDFSPQFQPDGQDSRERANRIMEDVRNGIPQFFEWRHSRLNGELFDAEVSLAPLNIKDKKQFIAIVRDITERKKAEEELRKKDFIIQSASSVIATAGIDGTMTYVNPAFLQKWGFDSPDEVIGRPFTEFWMVDDILDEILSDLKGVRKKWGGEIKAKKKDGSLFDVYVAAAAVLDDRGEAIALMSTSIDITERVQAESALHEALAEVQRMKEMIEAENVYLQQEIRMAHLHGDIVGQSDSIKSVMAAAEQVAATDSTVLILGETGTGKELLARAIHNMSLRREHPLVVVNCAAIPSSLVESELFGREKGAYTGADTRKIGRFEIANGSTIFLDEIGELSLEIQAKLLRVLQEGQIERLGSTQTIKVDVRVIAATNRDLEKEIKADRFREDLYYRLNVFPITIPPLRERKEDLPELVWHFVNEMNQKMGKRVEKIPAQSIEAIENHTWPGNVRELHNVIERAMIQTQGKTLRIGSLSKVAAPAVKGGTLAEIERQYIMDVLERTGWRVRGEKGAAKILGIKPTTLEARMSKLGIKRDKKAQ